MSSESDCVYCKTPPDCRYPVAFHGSAWSHYDTSCAYCQAEQYFAWHGFGGHQWASAALADPTTAPSAAALADALSDVAPAAATAPTECGDGGAEPPAAADFEEEEQEEEEEPRFELTPEALEMFARQEQRRAEKRKLQRQQHQQQQRQQQQSKRKDQGGGKSQQKQKQQRWQSQQYDTEQQPDESWHGAVDAARRVALYGPLSDPAHLSLLEVERQLDQVYEAASARRPVLWPEMPLNP